jgi:oligopeptide/dipeptide ABC transporter ATP-binding protein
MLAMAFSCSPELVIADEPTTSLDVTVQAQILAEIRRMRDESGVGVILVTHDLAVVAQLADRVCVMYGGRIVEQAPIRDLFANPQHPYTWGLLQCMMKIDSPRRSRLAAIPGTTPSLLAPPSGCHFQPRCGHRHGRCSAVPPLAGSDAVDPRHLDRCWLPAAEKARQGSNHQQAKPGAT